MVRCVAVLLCLAASQGLRLTKPKNELKYTGSEKEMQSVLAAAAQNGLTYPAVCDLMVADSDELFDLPDEEAELIIDPSAPMSTYGDPKKIANSTQLEQKVVKQGDGKTFLADGDMVKVRMTGSQRRVKNLHDTNFDAILSYEYPLPKMPATNGQKPPAHLANVSDKFFLSDMSLGSIKQIDTTADTKQGKLKSSIQLELLEVIKKGPATAKTLVMEEKPSAKETFIRNLEKQSAQGLTMNRKVVKEGDGKTFVNPGDTVTLRVLGTAVQGGKKIDSNSTATFEYPLLATPFKTKFNGVEMAVKFSWDQKMLPGMSEGEIHHVAFDPVMGQKIPPFKVELVKVNKGK